MTLNGWLHIITPMTKLLSVLNSQRHRHLKQENNKAVLDKAHGRKDQAPGNFVKGSELDVADISQFGAPVAVCSQFST